MQLSQETPKATLHYIVSQNGGQNGGQNGVQRFIETCLLWKCFEGRPFGPPQSTLPKMQAQDRLA